MNFKILSTLCIFYYTCLVNSLPYPNNDQTRIKREASEVGDLNDKYFSQAYDSGKGGDIGHLRKKAEKHSRGYELYDSFHKKHEDDFEFDNADKKKKNNGDEEEEASGALHSESRSYEEKPKKKAIFSEGYEVTEEHDGDDDSHSSYHAGDADSGENVQSQNNEADYDEQEQSGPYIKSTPIGDYVYHEDDEEDDY